MSEGQAIIYSFSALLLSAALALLLVAWRAWLDIKAHPARNGSALFRWWPNRAAVSATNALSQPAAGLQESLKWVREHAPNERYPLLIGWCLVNGKPWCVTAPLVGDTYHTLITGQSRTGKDNLALNALFGLSLAYSASRVQFCIIDGKGLDFIGFEGKSHTWHLALRPAEIAHAMEKLTAERERRVQVLRAAQVSKWESYRGDDLPLLVCYISELSLLEDAVGKPKLTAWLNSELAASAAFGIRYIIATQTVSGMETRWRNQISLYLAAFQPSQSADQPNTGLTTREIRAAGGVPPSELPPPPVGAGVFTAVWGQESATVRCGLIDDGQRQRWLRCLPDAARFVEVGSHPDPQHQPDRPLPVAPDHSAGANGHGRRDNRNGRDAAQSTDAELTDEEIRMLLREGVARRQIAAKLRGSMQKRLARIAQVEAEIQV